MEDKIAKIQNKISKKSEIIRKEISEIVNEFIFFSIYLLVIVVVLSKTIKTNSPYIIIASVTSTFVLLHYGRKAFEGIFRKLSQYLKNKVKNRG